MDLNTQLIIPPQVMSRLVGEETVLLDLATGMYFGLDGVGKIIWESVADGCTLARAADAVVDAYDVDVEKAQADVLSFAGDLVDRGLLVE